MSKMSHGVEYVKGYTLALLGLGVFLFLGALQLSFTIPRSAGDPALAFISSLLCMLGLSCLVVCMLRWMRVAAALPATTALSFCLLLAFPLGTLLSLYWLKKVRPKELVPQDRSRRWLNSTVGLYIFGLLMLDMALTVRFVRHLSEPPIEFLAALELGGWILGSAALAAGAVISSLTPAAAGES
jgi:hypothetical protein